MEINSDYNKAVLKTANKKLDVNVQEQATVCDEVLSATDKDASSAISAMGKTLVKQTFKPAQTKEELISQIENIPWLENKKLSPRATKKLTCLSEDWIIALSEVLHKSNGLSPSLKTNIDVSRLIDNCDDFNKDEKLKNLKNFSPEVYNALNINLQKELKPLPLILIRTPLTNPDALNQCYSKLDEQYRDVVTSYIVFNMQNPQQVERNLKLVDIVSESNEELVKKIDIENIFKSPLTTSQIAKIMEFFTTSYSAGSAKFSREYLCEVLTRNYSYALDNQTNKPVCGTEAFKPFSTKEELKTELASMRLSNGQWMFSNAQIEHIINNENDIAQLSKILHEIAKSGIQLLTLNLEQILTREGVTFDIIKPLVDFYTEVQSDDKNEKLLDVLRVQFDALLKLNEDGLENLKRNVPLLDILYEEFEDSYGDDLLWRGHQLFSILKNSKMSPEIFRQLINGDIFDDISLSESQKILREEDVKIENIKLLKDLKSNPKLSFLFEENGYFELSNDEIISILKEKLPENFDLSQKVDIIDFLAEIHSLESKNNYNPIFYSGKNYVQLLTKSTDDTAQNARKLYSFLDDNDFYVGSRINFFLKHSFSDTLRLLEDFYANPLLIDKCSAICDYDIGLLDDLLKVADYAATLGIFAGAKIDIARDLKDYSSEELKLKMNTETIKSNMDSVSLLYNKVSPKLWDEIKSTMLDACILDAKDFLSDIKEENIPFVDAFLNDERFSTYFDTRCVDFLGLLQKNIDVETLKFNLDNFYNFVEKYSNNEKIEIANSNFITFNGDISKVSSKIEQIFSHYPNSDINVSYHKGEIVVFVDSNLVLTFDKNMNFISKQKIHEMKKEDGTTYRGYISNDKKLSMKNYLVQVSDVVYGDPRVEKLTSKYINEAGEIERTKVYKSSLLDGVFDIKETSPNGDLKVISSASLEGNSETIEKHLTSPSGVVSDIYYTNDGENENYRYVIKSANGDILSNLVRTSEKIDEKTKITSVNDRKYRVQYADKKIDICDLSTGETTSIDLTKLNPDKDPVIQELLRSLSGDELIKTAEFVNKIVLVKRIKSEINPFDRTMSVGPHKFIFEHELGHGKDAVFADIEAINGGDVSSLKTSKIAYDKTLNEIFEREKKIAKETAPECILREIHYFIADADEHYGGEKGGLREVIAETNAIQTTARFHPLLKMRAQILQEYFPETIAYLLNNHLI